jgi:hypothetical protein
MTRMWGVVPALLARGGGTACSKSHVLRDAIGVGISAGPESAERDQQGRCAHASQPSIRISHSHQPAPPSRPPPLLSVLRANLVHVGRGGNGDLRLQFLRSPGSLPAVAVLPPHPPQAPSLLLHPPFCRRPTGGCLFRKARPIPFYHRGGAD